MEYIDRQQGIVLTDEDFNNIMVLQEYIFLNIDDLSNAGSAPILYKNGLRLELLETEYKDLPIKWVISLFS